MSGKDARIEKVLAFHTVRETIEEAVGNWTQNWEQMDPVMQGALKDFAKAAAEKILNADLPFPNFAPKWKEEVSNRVYKAMDFEQFIAERTPIVVERLRPQHGDTSHEFEGLWGYSLAKIAHTTGCIAYMVAKGYDPEIILMNSEESHEAMQKLVDSVSQRAPDKLIVADPSVDTPEDILTEIRIRVDPPDIGDVLKRK